MTARGSPEWRQAISLGLAGRHSTRGNPKLTAAQHERIARLFQDGAAAREIADRFSISVRHAYLLRSRTISATLPAPCEPTNPKPLCLPCCGN